MHHFFHYLQFAINLTYYLTLVCEVASQLVERLGKYFVVVKKIDVKNIMVLIDRQHKDIELLYLETFLDCY